MSEKKIDQCVHVSDMQSWCSGESTHLPSMWPRFDSGSVSLLVEFVYGSQLAWRIFPGYCGFRPLSFEKLTPLNSNLISIEEQTNHMKTS